MEDAALETAIQRYDYDIDVDDDGLIEIRSLTILHNMRYNLAGTSYKTSATAPEVTAGCPGNTCTGYELVSNLSFDTDSDGTWDTATYALDTDDNQAPYFVVANGGWEPIGDSGTPFTATFNGNGYTITGLAVQRDQTYIGFFGYIGGSASIRNVGLVGNLADYSGMSNNNNFIGGLVGYQNGGSITDSYTTGNADGGGGNNDYVAGLVGQQDAGSIVASYATGTVDGGLGSDNVGGLVSRQQNGNITASYATGNTNGEAGSDYIGGLVGQQVGGSITRQLCHR